MELFLNVVIDGKPLKLFSEYTSEILKLNVILKLNLPVSKGSRKGFKKHLRKNEEKKILQERRGVLQKHVKIGLAK